MRAKALSLRISNVHANAKFSVKRGCDSAKLLNNILLI
jgi:hypothetical protein